VEIWGGGGTLASMGPHALAVQEHLSRRLGLRKSNVPWYNLRDQFGEMISNLGLLAATIERICLEVGRLSSTEIGEMWEPQTKTQVGSSTMPQKRNPINGERAAATCKLVRGLVPVMQECMIVSHERDMANTAAEWLLVPQAFILIDGAMELARHILVDLQIDAERMTQNLELTRGGIVAEAVMMGLAEHMGKARAHDLSLELTKEATAKRVDLLDVLMNNPEVRAALSLEDMRNLVRPENYVGIADHVVDSILDEPCR
jgi:3-carboxy-cis,cis-muconate cycloisomerase